MPKKSKPSKPKKEVKVLTEEDIKKLMLYFMYQNNEMKRRKQYNE